jgi:hypothetical protein
MRRRVQRHAGGQGGRHHLPPARLLGTDRPDPAVAVRRRRERQPAPRYSYKDLLELRVSSRRCSTPASSSSRSVRCSATSASTRATDIASAHLVINGSSVVLADGDELIDVLNKGQGVLNVLSLAGVKDEVDAQLVPLAVRRPARLATDALTPPCARSPLDAVHRAAAGARRWCRSAAGRCRSTTARARSRSTSPAERRRGVRRVAPRHRPGQRGPTPSSACSARSPTTSQDRTRSGAVHPPARRDRRVGARRHHRLVAPDRRRAGVRRDAERVQHRPRGRRDRWDRHHATRAVIAVQGPDARAICSARVAPSRRRRTIPRRAVPGSGVRASWRAPATPVSRRRDRRPGRPRPRCGTRSPTPASVRPASAPATRCGSKQVSRCTVTSSGRASPRCRPGSAGWWLGQAGVPRPRCAARRARARPARLLVGIATEGRRPPRADCPSWSTVSRWGGHLRQLLPGARPRHRARRSSSRTSPPTGVAVEVDVRGRLERFASCRRGGGRHRLPSIR